MAGLRYRQARTAGVFSRGHWPTHGTLKVKARLYLTRLIRLAGLLPFLVIACGCTQQRSQPVRESPESRSSNTQWHGLAGDEQRGGHTLQRHVGKSDMELRARLVAERNISAASTYADRETAEIVVTQALTANQPRIQQWLRRPGGHPNFVLDYDANEPIGRSLHRNAEMSQPCSHVVVVLRWVSADDFIVLTSYPECR